MPKSIRSTLLAMFALALVSAPAAAQDPVSIYGYFATRLEKSFNVPAADGTDVVKESGPREFGYPFVNVMLQSQLSPRFKVFANLNGAGAGELDVRNIWGEWSPSAKFNVRVGKSYRKFGLYNEVLDAVPTYYGIEPPEAFDSDHLLISRTTALMVHGQFGAPKGRINYSFSTDNGEGQTVESTFPVGYDVNYQYGTGQLTLGLSGYTSGGSTDGDVSVGEGSPKSGVLPWMAEDEFTILNAYAESKVGALTLQAEWARGSHDAQRDADAIVEVVNGTGLNDRQRARFLVNPAGPVDVANVNTNGSYDVTAWYLRGGYSFFTEKGEIGPYVQYDRYSNPETIASKRFGGDAEAGESDDGNFSKITVGTLFRPIPNVALKIDSSVFQYNLLGRSVRFHEIRLDLSYAFGL